MNTLPGFTPDRLERLGARHTAREIAQQPDVWRETARAVRSRGGELGDFLGPLLGRPELRIVLTGAGTSAFAGDILAPALSRELGRRVDAVATTDLVSNPREYFAEDLPTLLVSFARSGNSPESVAATALADRCLSACHHLVLTCDAEGQLYRDHSGSEASFAFLLPEATNDQGFAMTSSFTSMLLAAWLIFVDTASEDLADRLAEAAGRLLEARGEEVLRLASSDYERVVYLGSGPLKGLAHESALKMLELTAGAVITLFDSPMGFRHGPKSVLDRRTLAIVYISGDPHTRLYDLDLLDELGRSMRAEDLIAVSATPHADDAWTIDGLDGVEDPMLALPFVLVAQLLGLYSSLALGRTPDNPFPEQEVNRVVQGVTIHPLEERR